MVRDTPSTHGVTLPVAFLPVYSTPISSRLLLDTVKRKGACLLNMKPCLLVSAFGQILRNSRVIENPPSHLILPVHCWVWVCCLGFCCYCFDLIFLFGLFCSPGCPGTQLYSLSWPQTPIRPHASACTVPRLQECTINLGSTSTLRTSPATHILVSSGDFFEIETRSQHVTLALSSPRSACFCSPTPMLGVCPHD